MKKCLYFLDELDKKKEDKGCGCEGKEEKAKRSTTGRIYRDKRKKNCINKRKEKLRLLRRLRFAIIAPTTKSMARYGSCVHACIQYFGPSFLPCPQRIELFRLIAMVTG